ncbi:MAG: GFA family protein [Amphiplicatus sp.]
MSHQGACFCGAVKISVSGEPAGMGYCHCRSCQSWSGGPVNAFTLWPPAAVKVTAGRHHLKTFKKTPLTERKYCGKCGGHLMSDHPTLGVVDVFAATVPTLAFKPGLHINYADTVLPMKDGLPKFRDFPSDFGGTGEQMAE